MGAIVVAEPFASPRCSSTMRFARLLPLAVVALSSISVASAKSPPPVEAKVVATGRAPCGVTAREGAIWVGVYEAGSVLRIDPASGRITKRIRVGRWACRVAVDRKALWVTRDRAGLLVRVNRKTGRRSAIEVGRSPFDVLLARGALWVTSYEIRTIVRIDAARVKPTRLYRDGGFPAGVTFCGGRVWIGHGRDITWLTAIDPVSHRITRADAGTPAPAWPRCVRGELWVTTRDSVLRIDPRTGSVRARLRIGGTPAEAAAAPDGLVWVTDKEHSLVHRIDPKTNTLVDSFAAGPGAYAMAHLGRSMWVTSFAGNDIRRYDP